MHLDSFNIPTKQALRKVLLKRKRVRVVKPRTYEERRRNGLKAKYGITGEQYAEMVSAQGGVCSICGNPPSGARLALFVDHCHNSKKVRGLLCGHCNSGLGYFKDSAPILRKAIEYLGKV